MPVNTPEAFALEHPCLRCGACCAAFRVAFHWLEGGDAGVPASLSQSLDPHRLEMRRDAQMRCVALDGQIGTQTLCTIYARRPSPCRDLLAAFENGLPSPQCDSARARHGLRALTPADWPEVPVDY